MDVIKRGTGPNALRRGRSSEAGAEYFISICVEPRVPALQARSAAACLTECHLLESDGAWILRCVVVMPDHVHVLATLGSTLRLSQAIARFKFRTREFLRAEGVGWQANFYDHRMRSTDSVEATIRYIWLNPYRAALIAPDQVWPFFYCRREDWAWFKGLTNSGRPFPEWLDGSM